MTGGVAVYGRVGRRDVPLRTQGVACYGVLCHVGFAAELTWCTTLGEWGLFVCISNPMTATGLLTTQRGVPPQWVCP
jgi:hypothetical protein